MKQWISVICLVTFSILATAQKKEKIKGSRIVRVIPKQLENFSQIEITDNFEVYLVKSDVPAVEVEADDNLHSIVKYEIVGNQLKISTDKQATSFKKLSLRINYTPLLEQIIVRDEVTLYALANLEMPKITIHNFDKSRSYLNVDSPYFSLIMNDDTEAEINSKSETIVMQMSKNARLKALFTSQDAKIDMYQKTLATIEGDVQNATVRLDNSAQLIAKKWEAKEMNLTVESYTDAAINSRQSIQLQASGKSEVALYGSPKITINQFTDQAILSKK